MANCDACGFSTKYVLQLTGSIAALLGGSNNIVVPVLAMPESHYKCELRSFQKLLIMPSTGSPDATTSIAKLTAASACHATTP